MAKDEEEDDIEKTKRFKKQKKVYVAKELEKLLKNNVCNARFKVHKSVKSTQKKRIMTKNRVRRRARKKRRTGR